MGEEGTEGHARQWRQPLWAAWFHRFGLNSGIFRRTWWIAWGLSKVGLSIPMIR